MIEVEVPDENDSVIELDIGGRDWFLGFRWNSEDDFWVLSIENSEQQTIISGVKITPNKDLLLIFRHLNVPSAEIYCVCNDNPLRSDFVDGKARIIINEL